MTETRRIPQRTCVGCRSKGDATGLFRFIAPEGQVLPATTGKVRQPGLLSVAGRRGRGAWLHYQEECVAKAIKTNSFARAFKHAVAEVNSISILAHMRSHAGRTNNAQGDLR